LDVLFVWFSHGYYIGSVIKDVQFVGFFFFFIEMDNLKKVIKIGKSVLDDNFDRKKSLFDR